MPSTDFAAGLDRLYALVDDDHTAPGASDLPAAFAYAALRHIVDLSHGISLLHRAGLCFTVPPLMRSLLEYTVGILWLADAKMDAVGVLIRGARNSGGRLLTHMQDAGHEPEDYWPQEIVQDYRAGLALTLDRHSDEYMLSFTNLLRAYGFDEQVAVYDMLSMHSHFNLAALARRLPFPRPGIVEQLDRDVDCEREAFKLLFEAAETVNGLLVGVPWMAGLARIRSDYDIPPSVKPQRRPRPSSRGTKRAKGGGKCS